MNTTTTAELVTTTRRPARRIRSILVLVAVAVGSLVGLEATSAAPASAATSVTFCFKHSGSRTAATYMPVQLWQVNAYGTKVGSLMRSGKTGSNGCATFYNTNSGVKLRVFARATYGDANIGWVFYDGATPLLANPGAGGANLTTGLVNRTCVAGYYDNLCRNMPY